MRIRLHSAYFSVKRNMSLLWTFYDHPETGLPNTNKAIEDMFSDIKTKISAHCRISNDNRKKLIDEYVKRDFKPLVTAAGIHELRRLKIGRCGGL